jgi:hypothetical protein
MAGDATFPTFMELKPPRLNLVERLYLPEIFRGVAVTTGHFVRNMSLHALHLFGLAKNRSAMVTVQYPEQRKVYSEGYRRLSGKVHPHPGRGAPRSLRREVPGALRDRYPPVHLLRDVRRGLPV